MKQYLDALRFIMDNGTDRPDRTGVGTRALFGMQMRYRMSDGFPAMTTKKLAFNAVKAELLWFLKGSSDVKELQQMGSHIWDANAEASYWKPHAAFPGDVGRIYGVQWRKWKSPDGREIDQIARVIERLKNKSHTRRLIVNAWNPGELDYEEQSPPAVALAPCHTFFQLFVADGKLSLQMYQRSCDMFLGVPFNIASYSLLLHMLAQATGLVAHEFVHTLGDAHIYFNHFDQVKEQLQRAPYPSPQLKLNPAVKNIDDFTMEDIDLVNYKFHPTIKAPMAV